MATGVRLPETMPRVARAGHGDTFEEIRSAFEPEVGVVRRRNRMRAAPRIFDLQLELSQDEFSIFDNWWQTDIRGGELDFDIQLLDDVDTLVWYTVHAVGDYSATVIAPMDWRVNFKVKALGDSFGTERDAATDTLGGLVTVGVSSAKGRLRVYTPFYGVTTPTVTAIGKANMPSLYGSASIGMFQLPRGVLNELP